MKMISHDGNMLVPYLVGAIDLVWLVNLNLIIKKELMRKNKAKMIWFPNIPNPTLVE